MREGIGSAKNNDDLPTFWNVLYKSCNITVNMIRQSVSVVIHFVNPLTVSDKQD